MTDVNKPEADNKPPICHFTPMFMDSGDAGFSTETWWECSHCGHTKPLSTFHYGY